MLNRTSTAGLALVLAAAFAVGCDEKERLGEPTEDNQRPLKSDVEKARQKDQGERAYGDNEPQNAKPRPGVRTAEAELKGAEGIEMAGEVEFAETGKSVHIVATVEGAPPGQHGIHIHERGDCSNISEKSMGGHFAPQAHPHALPSQAGEGGRHLGDLGNIEVGEEGEGRLEISLGTANLNPGDKMSLLGKAVVIHEGMDQGSEHQPSGNSGKPIACGVINL